MSNLCDDLTAEGRYPEAERLIRQVIETRRRVLGPDHPDTMTATISLASLYRKEGRYDEAEELTRATLERQRKVLGESHPSCALSVYNLAAIAAAKGDRENALELLRSAVDHKLETDVVTGIENDPDLKVLHGDPRFEGLVREAKQRAAPSTR
jgi:tetratricopeptide (TPR) repeat protein